jgi:hypothetical protein
VNSKDAFTFSVQQWKSAGGPKAKSAIRSFKRRDEQTMI